ncbi:MAG TPA: hypothetical protein VLA09_14195 [Longimicrobiales bacterium]|nr:hypothetical protein [Longimicrobiales bacterium]
MNRTKRTICGDRLTLAGLAVLALVGVSACASYRSVADDAVAAPAEVRIRFAPARDIWVHSAQDSIGVTSVVELFGRVTEKDSTTVTLEVSRAQVLSRVSDRPVPMRFAAGSVTRVPMQNVAVREARTGRTVLLVLGLVVVAAIVIGAATAPDPEPAPPKEPKTTA